MKKIFYPIAFLILTLFTIQTSDSAAFKNNIKSSPREKLLMDFGWKFHLGNASNPKDDFGYGTGAIFAKA